MRHAVNGFERIGVIKVCYYFFEVHGVFGMFDGYDVFEDVDVELRHPKY